MGDVAFEAPHDFWDGEPFCFPSRHIGPGFGALRKRLPAFDDGPVSTTSTEPNLPIRSSVQVRGGGNRALERLRNVEDAKDPPGTIAGATSLSVPHNQGEGSRPTYLDSRLPVMYLYEWDGRGQQHCSNEDRSHERHRGNRGFSVRRRWK